jgi:hypothetical protein
MPTIITEEPTTGPDTFILRRLRKDGTTKTTGIFRLREGGHWHPVNRDVGTVHFTWANLTKNPDGHEVTIELLAVPPVEAPSPEGLNLPSIEDRTAEWNALEHKWETLRGRGLALGLIQTELPKLIALAKSAAPVVTLDPELDIESVKHRMDLWNDSEHKWTAPGARGIINGLMKRELPMLIAIAEAVTASAAVKTEA